MGAIDKRRNGRWRARYNDPSGRRRSKTFDKKSEAQRFLIESESDVIDRTWRDPDLEKITYRHWVDEWWTTTVNLRPSTRVRDESYIRNHLLPRFADVQLGALSPREIRRWIAELVEKGLAPATVKKAYQILHKTLQDAVEAGILIQSPCRGISLPKVEETERPVLNALEVFRVADEIDSRYRVLVLLAAYSSMRWGELITLTPGRLDFAGRTVNVLENTVELSGKLYPPSPPKTRAGRRKIPLPVSIIEELRQHIEARALSESDLLFQAPEGGSLRKSFGPRFWTPATKKAGVYPFRFHDLRHTAISYWILCGASPKQIAKWAGHTSVSVVLDRYGHLFPEADEKPMAALEAMFQHAREKRESESKGRDSKDSPDSST